MDAIPATNTFLVEVSGFFEVAHFHKMLRLLKDCGAVGKHRFLQSSAPLIAEAAFVVSTTCSEHVINNLLAQVVPKDSNIIVRKRHA